MAITASAFKGNASVTYDGNAMGGLRSAAVNATQGTWDSTAFDNTSGARTYAATYNDSTCTLTGVFDPADTGQTTLGSIVTSGAAASLVVTFETNVTFTVSAICTEFSCEGDYEGGWTWTASFQQAAAPTWDLNPAA